jgi:hypothetical protein
MVRMTTILGAAAIALVAGCGGSSNLPPVDGTKQISSVSPADKASLCDWFSNLVGGYGTPSTCSMAVLSAPTDQADCLGSFPTCAVPVSTFETCVQALVSAQQTCTEQSMTAAETSAACVTVGQAGCFN